MSVEAAGSTHRQVWLWPSGVAFFLFSIYFKKVILNYYYYYYGECENKYSLILFYLLSPNYVTYDSPMARSAFQHRSLISTQWRIIRLGWVTQRAVETPAPLWASRPPTLLELHEKALQLSKEQVTDPHTTTDDDLSTDDDSICSLGKDDKENSW